MLEFKKGLHRNNIKKDSSTPLVSDTVDTLMH